MSIDIFREKFDKVKSTKAVSQIKPENLEEKLSVISPYFFNKTFLHAKHAEDMIALFDFIYDGQTLWRYDKSGYFKNDGEAYYRVIGQELIGKSSKRIYINESLYYAHNQVQLLDDQQINPPTNLINVKNGMLNPLTGELLPHSPKYLSTYQLPVKYKTDANDPEVHKFVSSILPEDSHDAFYEMIGYMLTNNLHLEKAFMFTGTGGNGKSVAINMISALIGKENVSNISLQDLDHRFRAGGIEGKLLNAFSDLPQKPIEDTGNFKAIVSQEPITIEQKNKNPKVIIPTVKLLFSANHLVVTPDMSDGYFRRWLIFEFNQKFTETNRDINLIQKLTTPEALSTLLNKAIEGIKRLHNNKQFSEGKSLKASIDRYRKYCDSVAQFIDEQCEFSDDYYVSTKNLYQHYLRFCDEWGIRGKLGKKNFNQRIMDKYGLNYKDKLIDRKGIQSWIGIKVKDELIDPFN